jgi:hypothetical protein
MSDITDAAEHIARRAVNAFGVLRDLERHLLTEQAEAVSAPREARSAPRPVRTNPDADADNPDAAGDLRLGHSDPVPSQAARIGYYTNRRRQVIEALDSINKAFDHAERIARAIVSTKPDPTLFDEPRCPGWTVELQARLGGCGKHLEDYTRNDGTKGLRSLCASCRKDKGKAERDETLEAERAA